LASEIKRQTPEFLGQLDFVTLLCQKICLKLSHTPPTAHRPPARQWRKKLIWQQKCKQPDGADTLNSPKQSGGALRHTLGRGSSAFWQNAHRDCCLCYFAGCFGFGFVASFVGKKFTTFLVCRIVQIKFMCAEVFSRL